MEMNPNPPGLARIMDKIFAIYFSVFVKINQVFLLF